jgi:hypothetical protein
MTIYYLPLLGSRDYIHGTTIFNLILRELQPGFPVQLRFNSLIRGALKIDAITPEKSDGVVSFGRADRKISLGLYGIPSNEPTVRQPFDEDAITATTQIDGTIVSSEMTNDVSMIARFIVMYKALVQARFPDAKGKWLFTGISATAWPDDGRHLKLEFASAVGTRMVKSRAIVDGREVAQILFSLAT